MRPEDRMGYRSALGSARLGFPYSVPRIFSKSKILPHPQDLPRLFLPSLFLAPCFLLVTICLHDILNTAGRIWAATGIAFAMVYTTCITNMYFSQWTVIIPDLLSGKIDETPIPAFHRPFFFEGGRLSGLFLCQSVHFICCRCLHHGSYFLGIVQQAYIWICLGLETI